MSTITVAMQFYNPWTSTVDVHIFESLKTKQSKKYIITDEISAWTGDSEILRVIFLPLSSLREAPLKSCGSATALHPGALFCGGLSHFNQVLEMS